eukprot:SAG31_NODE_139_length_22847_cov_8.142474_9_plen_74_part_00
METRTIETITRPTKLETSIASNKSCSVHGERSDAIAAATISLLSIYNISRDSHCRISDVAKFSSSSYDSVPVH